jgi:hypothetical protein
MLALLASGLVGLGTASRAWAAEPKDEIIEAEMLKDLDLLREADMAQQGELFRRMRIMERLRLLESLGFLEGSMPHDPATKEGN